MTKTPWGDTDELRARKLHPGARMTREEVARNQRERLFTAMVGSVAERGYEATSVADLVELSGVSRSAFYAHFKDKKECFVAALEETLNGLVERVALQYDGKGSALQAFIEIIVEQPATSRMCFLEAHPAGPEAVALMDRAVASMEALYAAAFADRANGAEMPADLIRAIVGGIRRLISTHLLRGTESELGASVPELWDWSFGYEVPPKPLRRRGSSVRRAAVKRPPPTDPAERIIEGGSATIAEKGYAGATIAEIVARAGVSLSTFYANFKGKDAVFWAALDAGQAQMFAKMLPVFRRTRGQGWPQAIRAGLEGMLDFLASEPDFARLAIVETYNAGPRAMELRNDTAEELRPYLDAGYRLAPELSPVVGNAIPGAAAALIYNQLQADGPESLPQIGATMTYLVLAPFVGAEEACAVARGER